MPSGASIATAGAARAAATAKDAELLKQLMFHRFVPWLSAIDALLLTLWLLFAIGIVASISSLSSPPSSLRSLPDQAKSGEFFRHSPTRSAHQMQVRLAPQAESFKIKAS